MKEVRIKIDKARDRDQLVLALANTGYHTWVEEEKNDDGSIMFFVVTRIPRIWVQDIV